MKALTYYFQAILEDGDYLNDWLTHIPAYLQPVVKLCGMEVSYIYDLISLFTN